MAERTTTTEERVATLTATVDQLQAEHDRLVGRVLAVCVCVALLAIALRLQEHRLELLAGRVA